MSVMMCMYRAVCVDCGLYIWNEIIFDRDIWHADVIWVKFEVQGHQ